MQQYANATDLKPFEFIQYYPHQEQWRTAESIMNYEVPTITGTIPNK